MNLFDLAAKITLDTSDYESKVKTAIGSAQQLAGAIGNGLANAAKIGAAGIASAMAGIGALTKSAVEGFAEYEQLVGGVKTLFGTEADSVEEYAESVGKSVKDVETKYNSLISAQSEVFKNAKNAYKDSGLSANEYMETVTSFSASLISSLGGNTEKAAKYANTAIVDMADNANKMGTDMVSIQNAYQGFAKQNYTMLDNLKLGYGGTQAEMQRLLDTANEINAQQGIATNYTLGNFADIVEAIHIVQTEIGITGTTAEEAAETISGSIASMKSALQNLFAGLANPDADMSELIDNFVISFETAFGNIQPAIETALINIGDVIGRIAPIILDKLPDLGGAMLDSLANVAESITGIDITPLTDGIKNALSGVIDVIRDLSAAFEEGGIDGVLDVLVQKFKDLTGLDLSRIVNGIGSFIDYIGNLAVVWSENGLDGILDKLVNDFKNLTGLDLSPVADGILNIVGVIQNLVQAWNEEGVSGVLDELNKQFKNLTGIDLNPLRDGFNSLVDSFKTEESQEAFSRLRDSFGNLYDAMKDLISVSLQPVVDGIGSFIKSIPGTAIIDALSGALNGLTAAIKGLSKVKGQLDDFFGSDPNKSWVENALDNINEFGSNVVSNYKFNKAAADYSRANGNLSPEEAKKAIAQAVQTGEDIAKGMEYGINSKNSEINKVIGGMAQSAIDTANDQFGINSPSRVFAQIGRYLILGFKQGFESEFKSSEKSMLGKFDSLVGGMNGTAKINFADSGIGRASAGTVNGIMAASSARDGGNYSINLVVDGKTLANVVYDPLNKISRQKGDGVYA